MSVQGMPTIGSELWYPERNLSTEREKLSTGQEAHPIICESSSNFHRLIRDELSRWNDLSDINTYLISLDGLSGSGKSSLSRIIRSVADRISGVSFYANPIDSFITTPRDSSLRSLMTESRRLFWRLIYDRQSVVDVLKGIVQANGGQCSIHALHHYNREHGSVGPAVVRVPAGRKVVVVDGIDSTRVLRALETIAPCPQMRVLVLAYPHIALERAAQRDAQQGRRTLRESREYRRREFHYLVPQICDANIKHVDVIYTAGGHHA